MSLSTEPKEYLIIGIGNEFRGDDAFGVEVIKQLQKAYPDLAEYWVEQDDLTRIIDKWPDRKVIIVDAILSQGDLGEIYTTNDILNTSFEKYYSSHSLGLQDALKLGQQLNKTPKELFFIGILGKNWKIGEGISAKITSSIPEVIKKIIERIGLDE